MKKTNLKLLLAAALVSSTLFCGEDALDKLNNLISRVNSKVEAASKQLDRCGATLEEATKVTKATEKLQSGGKLSKSIASQSYLSPSLHLANNYLLWIFNNVDRLNAAANVNGKITINSRSELAITMHKLCKRMWKLVPHNPAPATADAQNYKKYFGLSPRNVADILQSELQAIQSGSSYTSQRNETFNIATQELVNTSTGLPNYSTDETRIKFVQELFRIVANVYAPYEHAQTEQLLTLLEAIDASEEGKVIRNGLKNFELKIKRIQAMYLEFQIRCVQLKKEVACYKYNRANFNEKNKKQFVLCNKDLLSALDILEQQENYLRARLTNLTAKPLVEFSAQESFWISLRNWIGKIPLIGSLFIATSLAQFRADSVKKIIFNQPLIDSSETLRMLYATANTVARKVTKPVTEASSIDPRNKNASFSSALIEFVLDLNKDTDSLMKVVYTSNKNMPSNK